MLIQHEKSNGLGDISMMIAFPNIFSRLLLRGFKTCTD
jgi:hypothetical protein